MIHIPNIFINHRRGNTGRILQSQCTEEFFAQNPPNLSSLQECEDFVAECTRVGYEEFTSDMRPEPEEDTDTSFLDCIDGTVAEYSSCMSIYLERFAEHYNTMEYEDHEAFENGTYESGIELPPQCYFDLTANCDDDD